MKNSVQYCDDHGLPISGNLWRGIETRQCLTCRVRFVAECPCETWHECDEDALYGTQDEEVQA